MLNTKNLNIKNIYDYVIINIDIFHNIINKSNDIIDNIKFYIYRNDIKLVKKIIINNINYLTKENINELINYSQYINNIIENDIKNNTNLLKFIFYNILNILHIIIYICFMIYVSSNIYQYDIKILFLSVINILGVILFLLLSLIIKEKYPPVFIQKIRLQKNIEILNLLEKIVKSRV